MAGTFQLRASVFDYASAELDANGDMALVNDFGVYKANFTIDGALNPEVTYETSDISSDGGFVIATDRDLNLHWFDTSAFVDEEDITPDHSVAITEDVGTINKLVISDDDLTVFVLGSNKILVVPVWQIVENALGSSEVCPAAGCADIAVAEGVTP